MGPAALETVANYKVPKGEEGFYHVQIERKRYDETTGKHLSRPYVQKFGRKEYELYIKDSLDRQGYTQLILHDPSEKETAENATAE